MAFNAQQKTQLVTDALVGARKPAQDYITKFGSIDVIFMRYQSVGAAAFSRLAAGFYPDQLKNLSAGLTAAELMTVSHLQPHTLQSFDTVAASWIRSMLSVLTRHLPINYAILQLPDGSAGVPAATLPLSRVDQTSTNAAYANLCITERGADGTAKRNLLFNAVGDCVAEINFDNHGYNATSGHAHIYPVQCMPITGHHVSGTPEIDYRDCPALWLQLGAGIVPSTPLGT